MTIRHCTLDDAEALVAIYAPYVTDTAISYEYDVPTIEDFRQRITDIQRKYPYLVAEENGIILGYAYAHAFIERRAADHSVETTIYLDSSQRQRGIGRALYNALERELKAIGIKNLNAAIAWTDTPNSHLTHQSPLFHEKMGYTKVAHFHRCAYKFNEWYDLIWMEKII